jgi:hypothetical protein
MSLRWGFERDPPLHSALRDYEASVLDPNARNPPGETRRLYGRTEPVWPRTARRYGEDKDGAITSLAAAGSPLIFRYETTRRATTHSNHSPR